MSQARFLIESAERLAEEARAAERRDEPKKAKRAWFEAGKMMLLAAQETPADSEENKALRALRKLEGQEFVAKAKAIGQPKKKAAAKKMALQADESEGADEDAFVALERPDVRFDKIAGLEHAKEQIRLRMIYPFQNRDLASLYGIQKGGGMLLWGPPGTGKTLLARAVAGEIEVPFFSVKPSEIMSKFVGTAEKNIERLFETARKHPLSVIFIDEVEALVPRRAGSQSNVMTRLVPQILAELEGVDSEGRNPLLFIGATNEPWSLDPAVLRPGRFDVKVYVGLPDIAARTVILKLNLDGRPLAPELDLEAFARSLEGYSGADIRNICQTAAQNAFLEAMKSGQTAPIGLDDLEAARGKPSVARDDLTRFEQYRDRSWA